MEDLSDWAWDRKEIEIIGRDRKPTKEEIEKMKQLLWGHNEDK